VSARVREPVAYLFIYLFICQINGDRMDFATAHDFVGG
jgi:hypothetical protein